MGATKEEWSKTIRDFRDDEAHDDDLKWLGISKDYVFKFKKAVACMNAFGVGGEEKMRKY